MFLGGHVLWEPKEHIVADPVVDDLIQPLVGQHDAHSVKLGGKHSLVNL